MLVLELSNVDRVDMWHRIRSHRKGWEMSRARQKICGDRRTRSLNEIVEVVYFLGEGKAEEFIAHQQLLRTRRSKFGSG